MMEERVNGKIDSMGSGQHGGGRLIHVNGAAWRAALDRARELGCLTPEGHPSIGRLVTEIGEAALKVSRVKPARPLGMASRIREQIDLDPAATDATIARRLGSSVMQVGIERRRYLKRKANLSLPEGQSAPD